MLTDTDANGIKLTAKTGRDNGKQFHVPEVPPPETVTFVLRLLAAIRLGGVDELLDMIKGREDGDDAGGEPRIAGVLRLLAGCDPDKVRALMMDALGYMSVAPDPQHPGHFRKLVVEDIKEMATLGELLNAFIRVNVMPSV